MTNSSVVMSNGELEQRQEASVCGEGAKTGRQLNEINFDQCKRGTESSEGLTGCTTEFDDCWTFSPGPTRQSVPLNGLGFSWLQVHKYQQRKQCNQRNLILSQLGTKLLPLWLGLEIRFFFSCAPPSHFQARVRTEAGRSLQRTRCAGLH